MGGRGDSRGKFQDVNLEMTVLYVLVTKPFEYNYPSSIRSVSINAVTNPTIVHLVYEYITTIVHRSTF